MAQAVVDALRAERQRKTSRKWKRRHKSDPIYQQHHQEQTKRWWEAEGRNAYYLRSHGVTLAAFERQIKKQHSRCPIGNHPFVFIRYHGSSPVLDHDHEDGMNRDVLCRAHNSGLGYFHDSAEELLAGAVYLKRHKERKS